jgi:CRISPR-associated protein Csx3
MELFPALLIGGPPHSGKSVLAYSLSHAFRQRGLEHYLLRACPDGEGDWANEIDQAQVRLIRVKHGYDQEWVDYMTRDIGRRHLPLLVDVGGRPQLWQEPIFSACTHALLLAPTAEALAEWRDLARRNGLTILAELHSSLSEPAALWESSPLFKGRLAGLERGQVAGGPVFEALVTRLAPHFSYPAEELRRIHLDSAPTPNTLDLEEMARLLHVPFLARKATWQPGHLSALLYHLPAGEALALYGRGPNWLYTAVALHSQPAPFSQFDPRLGWVTPPSLVVDHPTANAPVTVTTQPLKGGGLRLDFSLATPYLDYAEAQGLTVPAVPPEQPLALSGKLPLWLTTALALTYRAAPLLAVYQPQVGAVVVQSRLPGYKVGDLWPLS